MPAGRPTSYRSEYCERAIELGKLGKSLAQIGAEFGVHRKTLWEWAEKYEEFREAIARARDLAMAWWETQAEQGIWETGGSARLNTQLWSRSMAARFPDDYRESKKTEVSGPDGGPVEKQVVVITGVPPADG